jgi:hypothetical protein
VTCTFTLFRALFVYDVQRNKKLFWKLEKLHFPFNNIVTCTFTLFRALFVYDFQRNKKLFWKLEKLHFPFNNSVVIATAAAAIAGVVVTKAWSYGLFQCFYTWSVDHCQIY